MKAEEFIDENEEYIIPVSWEVYSTIKVTGAKNLQDAIKYAQKYIDDIPLGYGEYIDDSYKIEIHNDDEAIAAQDYADIGDVVVDAKNFTCTVDARPVPFKKIKFICTDIDYACQVLYQHNLPFDLDSDDRIIMENGYADEARLVMKENDVDFDEV